MKFLRWIGERKWFFIFFILFIGWLVNPGLYERTVTWTIKKFNEFSVQLMKDTAPTRKHVKELKEDLKK